MSEEQLQQINIIEQSLNQAVSQKQQFEKLLLDTSSALEALQGSEEAYQIVGSVMIKKDTKTITADLEEKKERYEIRVKTLNKQETKLREQLQKVQESILKEMDENGESK